MPHGIDDAIVDEESARFAPQGLSISGAIGFVLLFFFMYVGSLVIIIPIGLAIGRGPGADLADALQLMIAWPVTIAIAARAVRFNVPGLLLPVSRRLVPPVLLASFGATILLLALAAAIPLSPDLEGVTNDPSTRAVLGRFLGAVVVAPIAEEVFYRGILLYGFMALYSRQKAVVASALIFAIMHLNPWQAVIAFPLGLAYAWVTLRTGSIIPAVISHAVVNLTAGFGLFPFAEYLYGTRAVEASTTLPASFLLLGAVAVGLGSYGIAISLRVVPPAGHIEVGHNVSVAADKQIVQGGSRW